MKRFITKTVLFALLSVLVIILIFIFQKSIINNNASFKIDDDIKYVVFGHSHSECAFDDSLIKGLKNFSSSGESYYYTLPKLKKILTQNPNVKTVFIEFTNNQLRENWDRSIWEDKYLSYHFNKWTSFLDIDDYSILMRNNLSGFVKYFGHSMVTNTVRLLKNDYNFIKISGGYKRLDRILNDSLIKISIKQKTDQLDKIKRKSVYTIDLLKKIVLFCNTRNVKVYFVRSPQNNNYKIHNQKYYDSIINSNFSDIELLDFSNLPLKNNQFADFEHLNYNGAKPFSLWFNYLLTNGLLDSEDKNIFIRKNINKIEI